VEGPATAAGRTGGGEAGRPAEALADVEARCPLVVLAGLESGSPCFSATIRFDCCLTLVASLTSTSGSGEAGNHEHGASAPQEPMDNGPMGKLSDSAASAVSLSASRSRCCSSCACRPGPTAWICAGLLPPLRDRATRPLASCVAWRPPPRGFARVSRGLRGLCRDQDEQWPR